MPVSRAFVYKHSEPRNIPVLLIQQNLTFSQVPGKGAPSVFPNGDLMERGAPFPEPMVYSFIHLFESPVKELSMIMWH
jgi:hypothetical protein